MRTPAPFRSSVAGSFQLPLLVVLSAAVSVLGCASSGSYHEGVYEGDDADFRVGGLGPEWTRIGVRDQNDLAFIHGPTSAVIQANASCQAGLDIPLEALRNHLVIGFTDRETLREERIGLDGREALDMHMRARIDGVLVELRLTVMKKNDCVFDMALMASPDAFPSVEASYDTFLRGFHTEGRDAPRAVR
ncbi:MAG: hypothetical protein KC593_24805 [Myxococcales bacterium]|nr:hypothetical protein [Myxococcales bacterium]MCB9625992.1 hypothetical protein [Sandaracinaceae bacterium]